MDAGEVLADVVGVGNPRTVAGHDVKIAVRAELEAAAVMPAVGPFEDDLLGCLVNDRRLSLDRKTRYARARRQPFLRAIGNPGHIDETIVLEFRMKREGIDDLFLAFRILQLEREVGLIDILLVDERPDLAPASRDEQAIGSRRIGQVERLLEFRQLGNASSVL